jgi:hypothetical protein
MKTLNIAASVTSDKPSKITTDISDAPKENRTISNNERLQRFIEEETKTVKGRFRCFDNPGSSVRIQVRKYKGVPMFDKTMIDEGTYEIPLYVARHLNGIDATATHINGKINSCSYPIHGFKSVGDQLPASQEVMGPDGLTLAPRDNIVKRVRRYGFESLEFSVE